MVPKSQVSEHELFSNVKPSNVISSLRFAHNPLALPESHVFPLMVTDSEAKVP